MLLIMLLLVPASPKSMSGGADRYGAAAVTGQATCVRPGANMHLISFRTGRAITQRLLDSKPFQDAKSVALYLTCASLNEVDTAELMQATLSHGTS